ncbi:MAG: hypothetical protein BGO54_10060 [Sphingobacteriales bacterium 46-32]|jgi:TonB-linked SusC/RagA family outer membrane protein|nr:MAG: hypothetical protein BGO54_10060 [Sphingobacteriales bacterium 46-32]
MRKLASLLAVLMLFNALAFAQQREVSGSIKSEEGTNIPFASVTVKGTATGVSADANGKFSIQAAPNATLVISAVGYEPKEVSARSTTITVSLKAAGNLQEVVVTALGISKQKKSLGYQIATVSPEDFNKVRPTDITAALAGKVAGMQLLGTPSSNFGEGQIRLRGISSLGGTDPIYVVDGTIVSLSAINLDEVESISVLKGPVASALYGLRAQNGAIEVKLKRGAKRKPGVTVNSLTEFGNVALLPKYQNEYGGGYSQDWQTFTYNPAIHPASWAAFNGQKLVEYGADESWGPRMDGTLVREWFSWYPGDDFGKETPFSPHPNNVKDFYTTSKRYNNSVAFEGGGDNSSFRFNYNNRYQELPFPNTQRQENLFSFRGNLNVTPKLTISTNVNYSVIDQLGDRSEGYTNDGQNITQNFNQWFQRQLDIKKLRDYKNPAGGYKTWNIRSPIDTRAAYWDNMYYQVYESFRRSWQNRVFGDINISYKILPYLTYTTIARASILNYGGDGRIASYGLEIPSYNINNGTFQDYNFENRLEFNKRFGNFGVRQLVGSNFMRQTRKYNSASTVGGLSVPDLYSISASIDRPSVGNTWLDFRMNSLYTNGSYDYKNFLFLDVTLRNDWTSSLLPGRKNTFLYPSVSTSFVFTDVLETSAKFKEILSYGKLRAGYGRTGTDPGAYALNPTYGLGTPYGSNPTMSVPTTVYDIAIKPSLTKEYEIGTELKFLKNRIGLDFAWYRKDGVDQIVNLGVTNSSGASSVWLNAGLIRSQGFDLAIDASIIKTRDFSWDVQFNIARNISKVIDLDSAKGLRNLNQGTASFGPSVNARIGEKWGAIIGTRPLIDEKTGLPVITAAGNWVRQTNQILGYSLPEYMGGAVTTFRYKNLSLSGTLTFQRGGMFYSTTRLWNLYSGLSAETVGNNDKGNPLRDDPADGGGIRVDGVLADGTPKTVYVEAQTYYSNMYGLHTPFLSKSSFLKLAELKLAYTIKANTLIKGIKDINIAASCRNPWLISAPAKKWGIDPSELENANSYYEGGQLPMVRSYGINVTFGF